MEASPWHIEAQRARLQTPWLRARVDVNRPGQGLQDIVFRDVPLEALRVLRIGIESDKDAAPALTECYTRGNDLVAKYTSASPHRLQPEIYWRAVHPVQDVAGIDVIVSMQTDQLDSDPRMANDCTVPACEAWCLRGFGPQVFQPIYLAGSRPWTAAGPDVAGVFLFRLTGHDASYVEIVSPSELMAVRLQREDAKAGSMRLTYQLFPDRLEKGVIRRLCIRSLLLPRAMDQQMALDHHLRSSAAGPPLAT